MTIFIAAAYAEIRSNSGIKMMNKPPLLLVAVIAVIVVAASFRFVQQRRERADNDVAPQQETLVEITAKREQPVTERRSRQRMVTPPEDMLRYEASVRALSGGWTSTFRLSATQYHALAVGERGTLRYQGTRFIAFEPVQVEQ